MKEKKYNIVEECILCHSKKNEWKILFQLNNDQSLMKCNRCGLIFNDNQRIDFSSIYSDDYYTLNENVSSGGGFHNYLGLEQGIQRMYFFAYKFILNRSSINQKYRLLDIGCSYGFFLKLFKCHNNFSVFGVELNEMAADETKKHDINVWKIPFEHLHEDKKYDYITFFELIEHTLSPLDTMKKINLLLHSGGYAIFSTPDSGSIFFKILKKKWPAIHPFVHNYYFDKKTISRLIDKSGFDVVSISTTHIMWSDFFHFRKRLSEMFPICRKLLKYLSFLDSKVVPFLNGGDLRIIIRKQ